mmetsp:Transcript_125038/g.361666  ORF Transcript_125038/g.361666 Transcript_125038/m.361666 type:complete len:354 (-) Transcript_125038:391-1452(-)
MYPGTTNQLGLGNALDRNRPAGNGVDTICSHHLLANRRADRRRVALQSVMDLRDVRAEGRADADIDLHRAGGERHVHVRRRDVLPRFVRDRGPQCNLDRVEDRRGGHQAVVLDALDLELELDPVLELAEEICKLNHTAIGRPSARSVCGDHEADGALGNGERQVDRVNIVPTASRADVLLPEGLERFAAWSAVGIGKEHTVACHVRFADHVTNLRGTEAQGADEVALTAPSVLPRRHLTRHGGVATDERRHRRAVRPGHARLRSAACIAICAIPLLVVLVPHVLGRHGEWLLAIALRRVEHHCRLAVDVADGAHCVAWLALPTRPARHGAPLARVHAGALGGVQPTLVSQHQR